MVVNGPNYKKIHVVEKVLVYIGFFVSILGPPFYIIHDCQRIVKESRQALLNSQN